MTQEQISRIDTQNMFGVLKAFPQQIKQSIQIGLRSPKFKNDFDKLIILGMGGSAIGGDLINTYYTLSSINKKIKIIINRDYSLPFEIDDKTAIIASSYSGNTEETISAFEQALKYTRNIITISSGGDLTKISQDHDIPVIIMPSGYQPRCAIAYSFYPMLYLLINSKVFQKEENKIYDEIHETSDAFDQLAKSYSKLSNENPAYNLAHKLQNKIPLIYTSNNFYSINLRWRCQIQENAKNCAFGNMLPEMNHNEINSYSYPALFKNSIFPIFIRDKSDHPRIKARFKAMETIFKDMNVEVQNISSGEYNLLMRIFDLIYLGDWTSFYLAILNNIDPTPIPIISKLKNNLG